MSVDSVCRAARRLAYAYCFSLFLSPSLILSLYVSSLSYTSCLHVRSAAAIRKYKHLARLRCLYDVYACRSLQGVVFFLVAGTEQENQHEEIPEFSRVRDKVCRERTGRRWLENLIGEPVISSPRARIRVPVGE